MFQRCLQSTGCVSAYRTAVLEIIEVYENAELEARATRYYEQIRAHVLSGRSDEYTQDEFERGYQALLTTIRERPAALRADLDR